MNKPNDFHFDDDELLAHLRDAMTLADPPPADLDERARRAFGWDAALSVLTESVSTLDAQPALRATAAPSVVEYQMPGVRVQLELEGSPNETITIIGSIDPVPTEVYLVDPNGGPIAVDVDERGRFAVNSQASAVVVQIVLPDGQFVRTPAVELTPEAGLPEAGL